MEKSVAKLTEQEIVPEIVSLHREIESFFKQSLDRAVRIGELLSDQKAMLPHGRFAKWINENLPFTDRTARNYMMLYRRREELKTENVSVLAGAYRLLTSKPTEGLRALPEPEQEKVVEILENEVGETPRKLLEMAKADPHYVSMIAEADALEQEGQQLIERGHALLKQAENLRRQLENSFSRNQDTDTSVPVKQDSTYYSEESDQCAGEEWEEGVIE